MGEKDIEGIPRFSLNDSISLPSSSFSPGDIRWESLNLTHQVINIHEIKTLSIGYFQISPFSLSFLCIYDLVPRELLVWPMDGLAALC